MMIWFWDEDTFGLTEERKKNNAVRFFSKFSSTSSLSLSLSPALVMYAIYMFCYLTVNSILPPGLCLLHFYIQHPSSSFSSLQSLSPPSCVVRRFFHSRYTRFISFSSSTTSGSKMFYTTTNMNYRRFPPPSVLRASINELPLLYPYSHPFLYPFLDYSHLIQSN